MDAHDNVLFNINTSSLLYIGHSPFNLMYGLPGCIKEIKLNDEEIGLWNFQETIGYCGSCNR